MTEAEFDSTILRQIVKAAMKEYFALERTLRYDNVPAWYLGLEANSVDLTEAEFKRLEELSNS